MTTYFISGHLNLTDIEFHTHYRPLLRRAMSEDASFVVGDARGADMMAQQYLWLNGCTDVEVFHMLGKPRRNAGFPCRDGFTSDDGRDAAMTAGSDADIAWVRPGRGGSGTARNLKRRGLLEQAADEHLVEILDDIQGDK